MDYGSLFGGLGSIAGSFISANATENATRMQVDALNAQRQFVFQNLDPSVVNAAATAADQQNIQNRLALQARVDPALVGIRYGAEQSAAEQLGQLGQSSQIVQGASVADALANIQGSQTSQNALIDQALGEIKAGATLPPDVQNELVQAGLEQSGMVTGAASGKGVGGQVLRTILGTAGINLQQQRLQQASQLMNSAQGLEASRQQILQQLFPSLAQTQLATLGGTFGALSASNALMPNAGLTGSQVANIWAARVGASTQLAQSAADTAARGTMAAGQIWGNALGTGIGTIGRSGIANSILGGGGATYPTATEAAVNASIAGGPQTMPSY